MTNDDNFLQTYSFDEKSSSLIEELEAQILEALEKKKKKVEEELQEKIRLEQEEARKKIDQIEGELTEDQGTLGEYKNILSQFEADKKNIKTEIKEHLERTMQLQSEIEEITRMSLQELEIASELSKNLIEIDHEFEGKVSSFKSVLKDKYDIMTQVQESNEQDEVDLNLKKELAKLSEIKNLLSGSD